MTSKLFLASLVFLYSISTSHSYIYKYMLRPKSNIIKMSMSENYLNNLPSSIKRPENTFKFTSEYTNQTNIDINTMYINVNKVSSVFFNPKSKSIMFMLDSELNDLYYNDNNTNFKLSNKTKVSLKQMKNFVITDMDKLVDGILYK